MKQVYSFIKQRELLAIFIFSFAIRLWNLGSDLPDNYQMDEPHHINIAAHFGTGDFNPHDFKYPTLWPYILAFMLAALYAAGRFTGLVSSSLEYSQKFLYSSGFFIFSGRLVSTMFLCFVPLILYRVGSKYYSKPVGQWAALLCALSSSLSEFGWVANPYSVLVFFAALSLLPLHAILYDEPSEKNFLHLGLSIGLAISSHYVAAPYLSLLLVSFYRGKEWKFKIKYFLVGLGAALVGFVLGSPFVGTAISGSSLHTFQFLNLSIPELSQATSDITHKIFLLSVNLLHFMDLWSVGFILVVVGAATYFMQHKCKLGWTLLPYIAAFPFLVYSHFGCAPRYTILLTIPFYLFGSMGLIKIRDTVASIKIIKIFNIFIICSFLLSFYFNGRYLNWPDTRTLAKEWIYERIPAGEKILLPGPFDGPILSMAYPQLLRLYQKTKNLHHPRGKYFEILLSGYAGGGYEVFFVQRTVAEVLDLPSRTERSFQAQELIDITTDGLARLKSEGIHWVVVLKSWETHPRYGAWVKELRLKGKLRESFQVVEGKTKGYPLEIYELQF